MHQRCVKVPRGGGATRRRLRLRLRSPRPPIGGPLPGKAAGTYQVVPRMDGTARTEKLTFLITNNDGQLEGGFCVIPRRRCVFRPRNIVAWCAVLRCATLTSANEPLSAVADGFFLSSIYCA